VSSSNDMVVKRARLTRYGSVGFMYAKKPAIAGVTKFISLR